MRKLVFWIVLLTAVGSYLVYVRGWDLSRLRAETIEKLPFVSRPEPSSPIGSRGSGTHWETAKPMPTPRSGIGGAAIGGKIYVVGGLDGYGRTLRTLEIYDIDKDEWSVGPMMPQAVHHGAVATDGQKLYVMGGFHGINFSPLDSAFSYDPSSKAWSEIENMGDFRGGSAGASAGSKMWIIGGANQAGPTGEVDSYDPKQGRWATMPKLATPRQSLATVVVDEKIYALGGRQGGLEYNLDVAEAFDPKVGAWKSLPAMPHRRGGLSAAAIDGRIFVFGGESKAGTFPEIDVFDSASKTWKSYGLVLPTPRHGLIAVTHKNRIYVIGGGRRSGFSVSDKNEVLILDGKLLGWSEKKQMEMTR